MKTPLTLTFAAMCTALCLAMLTMPGCTAADRAKAGEAAAFLDTVAGELEERKEDPVGDVAALVETKLGEMHESGLLLGPDYTAALAALNSGLQELDKNLPAPEKVDQWLSEMRRVQALFQSIADAPDDTAAIAQGIAGAAATAAPLAGPYAPWVALGGAALASIISAIGGMRAGRTKGLSLGLDLGVTRTAVPIDDARDTHIEKELAATHRGKRFLVVDRDKVAKSHLQNGVATVIERATKAAVAA